jgi:outer membrane protein assembly factor BamB
MQLLGALLLLLTVADTSVSAADDWLGFLGPEGTGISSEKGIKPWPANGPKVLWSLPLGEGYSAPIIVAGKCIVFDRVKDQARCRCLDATNAKELWSFSYTTSYEDRFGYDGGPRACPVSDGERVYLHGPDGILHALSLSNGKLLWKVDTLKVFSVAPNFFGVGSAPLINGDKLIVHIGGSPAADINKPLEHVASNNSAIVAFDKLTGKVLYQCGKDLASYASPQIVTLHGKKTGLIFARDGLLAFEPDKGVELFRYSFRARMLESVNVSNVLVHQDQILVSESYAAGSTLIEKKNDQWTAVWTAPPRRREAGIAAHMNTPIRIGEYVYGCTGRHPNEADLRCIEWKTGKVVWKEQPKVGDYQAGRGTLTYVDGHFLYLAEEGVLFLIKASSQGFEEVSVWDGRRGAAGGPPLPQLPEPAWAAPVVSEGRLFLRGQGKLVCLEGFTPQR